MDNHTTQSIKANVPKSVLSRPNYSNYIKNINSREKLNILDAELFRKKYLNYVKKMNSREFATLMIRHGNEKTRKIIIKQMSNKKIPIPRLLLDEINRSCPLLIYNSISEFYKCKNIWNKQQMESCNFEELYGEFECFVFNNFSE